MLTPVLAATTYFSAFEGGKTTCKRFTTNYFLYLLTSYSIYFTAMKFYDEQNVQIDKKTMIFLSLSLLILIISLAFVKAQVPQHFIFLAIL